VKEASPKVDRGQSTSTIGLGGFGGKKSKKKEGDLDGADGQNPRGFLPSRAGVHLGGSCSCFTMLWPGKVIGQAGGLGVEADLLRCCGSEVTVGGRG
jgi:hypothetical protein